MTQSEALTKRPTKRERRGGESKLQSPPSMNMVKSFRDLYSKKSWNISRSFWNFIKPFMTNKEWIGSNDNHCVK